MPLVEECFLQCRIQVDDILRGRRAVDVDDNLLFTASLNFKWDYANDGRRNERGIRKDLKSVH